MLLANMINKYISHTIYIHLHVHGWIQYLSSVIWYKKCWKYSAMYEVMLIVAVDIKGSVHNHKVHWDRCIWVMVVKWMVTIISQQQEYYRKPI
jgi:hypothetical protein